MQGSASGHGGEKRELVAMRQRLVSRYVSAAEDRYGGTEGRCEIGIAAGEKLVELSNRRTAWQLHRQHGRWRELRDAAPKTNTNLHDDIWDCMGTGPLAILRPMCLTSVACLLVRSP